MATQQAKSKADYALPPVDGDIYRIERLRITPSLSSLDLMAFASHPVATHIEGFEFVDMLASKQVFVE